MDSKHRWNDWNNLHIVKSRVKGVRKGETNEFDEFLRLGSVAEGMNPFIVAESSKDRIFVLIPVNAYRVPRPECSVFSAELNYTTQISPLDSSFKVVPITCDRIFAACNPVVKNVQ
jgi:hypothetical protein